MITGQITGAMHSYFAVLRRRCVSGYLLVVFYNLDCKGCGKCEVFKFYSVKQQHLLAGCISTLLPLFESNKTGRLIFHFNDVVKKNIDLMTSISY